MLMKGDIDDFIGLEKFYIRGLVMLYLKIEYLQIYQMLDIPTLILQLNNRNQ